MFIKTYFERREGDKKGIKNNYVFEREHMHLQNGNMKARKQRTLVKGKYGLKDKYQMVFTRSFYIVLPNGFF